MVQITAQRKAVILFLSFPHVSNSRRVGVAVFAVLRPRKGACAAGDFASAGVEIDPDQRADSGVVYAAENFTDVEVAVDFAGHL